MKQVKTYDVRKSGKGWQVVWHYGGSYTKTGYLASENDVKDGYFTSLNDAENHANNLAYESQQQ